MIHAVSLDLWGTLICDRDGDEAARDHIRSRRISELLSKEHLHVSEEQLYSSLRSIDVVRRDIREMRDWTLTTARQIRYVLTQAGVFPSPELVHALLPRYDTAIFELMPVLVEPDASQWLTVLAERFPLSITSNTGKTPGKVLKRVLEKLGILAPFTHFVFSDEVQSLKPDPGIWLSLTTANDVAPGEIVHVGDSYSLDYKGALDAGLHAVLFGRRPSVSPTVIAVDSLKQLPTTIQEMDT
ncbi:MAG TPA: HAD family hydrolase [Candidatus Cryosericum sp.]|nr:HAD family hydrolase [Candidatus Cryosericum sp.]HPS69186.1 HAD family hydrolase [Candidatus Cryosericum sp.]